MKENLLRDKSYRFAVRIVNLYKYMCEEKREYVMSKQVFKSGTSVGAMICESEQAESKSDFVHKLAVAQKEINETLYWLELMKDTDYVTQTEFESIYQDAQEIIKLITASIKTAKLTINH